MTAPVLVTVFEESELDVRLTAFSALLDEARSFGLPLPDHLDVWVTEPDAVAQVIIGEHIRRLSAAGRIVTVIADKERIGFRMDLGGVVYSVVHHFDRVTGSHAYSSTDVLAGAA